MRRLVIDADARLGQIAAVNTSFVNFGPATSARYARLIACGYNDLRRFPTRAGSVAFENNVYLYHLRHSSSAAPRDARVRRPRHVIVYRFDEHQLQIIALLHDSMDIPARLR